MVDALFGYNRIHPLKSESIVIILGDLLHCFVYLTIQRHNNIHNNDDETATRDNEKVQNIYLLINIEFILINIIQMLKF